MSTRQHLLAADFSAAWEGSHPAAQNGLLGWNFDPALATKVDIAGTAAGVLDVTKVLVPGGGAVSKIVLNVATAGVTPTTDKVWVGLYNSSLAKVATATSAASVTGLTGSAGPREIALTTTQDDVEPGPTFYFVVTLWTGGTAPVMVGAPAGGAHNTGLAATTFRRATGGTGLETLPATLPTLSAAATNPWVGLK